MSNPIAARERQSEIPELLTLISDSFQALRDTCSRTCSLVQPIVPNTPDRPPTSNECDGMTEASSDVGQKLSVIESSIRDMDRIMLNLNDDLSRTLG